MKSKLSVALAAAGCVLAVSPANAISVAINPGATPIPGAVLFDDFDSIQNTAIGTITGGFVKGPVALRLTTIRIRQPPSVVSPPPSLALDFPA
jgi:hypothetical protein